MLSPPPSHSPSPRANASASGPRAVRPSRLRFINFQRTTERRATSLSTYDTGSFTGLSRGNMLLLAFVPTRSFTPPPSKVHLTSTLRTGRHTRQFHCAPGCV